MDVRLLSEVPGNELEAASAAQTALTREHSSGRSRSKTRRSSEILGRLRVRCIAASNLAAGDVSLFQRTSDPYVQLQLRDESTQKVSQPKRTKHVRKTLNPVWKEDFWFSLRFTHNIVLNVAVFDYDYGKEDDFLGEVDVPLTKELLDAASTAAVPRDLELRPNGQRGKNPVSGTVKVEIVWIPSVRFSGVLSMRYCALLGSLSQSRLALRFLRVGFMGTSAALFLVASNEEWLCTGSSLFRCKAVAVPGTTASAAFAGLIALGSTFLHFASSAGMCGPPSQFELWNLFDDADADWQDGQDDGGYDHENSLIRLEVNPAEGLGAMTVAVKTSLFPQGWLQVVYLTLFWLHLSATGLAILALFLGWLHLCDDRILAEGWYLVLGGLLCLCGALATTLREKRLWAEAERNRWSIMADRPQDERRIVGGAGDFCFLEEWQELAHKKLSKLEKKAGEMARPFLRVARRTSDDEGSQVSCLTPWHDSLAFDSPELPDESISLEGAEPSRSGCCMCSGF